MGDLVFMESGKKRVGEYADCRACGQTFIRRKSGSNGLKVYCSPMCCAKAHRVRFDVKCARCQKEFKVPKKRFAASKSGLFFCSQKCMALSQRLESGITAFHPSHYGNPERSYKVLAFRNKPIQCVDCGERFLPFLVVHHIDGDRDNNRLDNLEIVCLNHHALRHMREEGGRWIYSSASITPREVVAGFLEKLLSKDFSNNEGLSFNGRTGP